MGPAISSTAVVRDYPNDPPACLQCQPGKLPQEVGGFIGVPSNESCREYFGDQGCVPQISGWTAAPLIFLYVFWGITLGSAIGWSIYRSRFKSQYKCGRVAHTTSDDPLHNDEEAQSLLRHSFDNNKLDELLGREMTLEFLKHSKAEVVAKILIVLNGLILFAFYFVLTFDFYYECDGSLNSIDNFCFFGTYRIFGDYENNSQKFFLIWIALVVYCVILAFSWKDIIDWVNLPVDDSNATKVRVWVQDEVHILSSGKLSWATKLRRQTEEMMRNFRSSITRGVWGEAAALQSTRSGRTATVPIRVTEQGRRYFIFECVRYSVPDGHKVKLSLSDSTIGSIRGLRQANGPDPYSRRESRDKCGPNTIPIELPSYGYLLLEEFMTPFYAYQLTIYLIWIWWTYWFVGLWLLLIVIFSGVWTVIIKRHNLKEVYSLTEHHDGVRVMRDQKDWAWCHDAEELVCGDVVKVSIEPGKKEWTVPADLVLVTGSCAVDESGLTGESMPCSKTAVSNAEQDASTIISAADPKAKTHILFAGTKVLEATTDASAVVLAIGSEATRGQLLSHVLFPVKTKFRFDEEFDVAVCFMLMYALVAFIISISFQIASGAGSSWATILAYGVLTISQIVSPILKLSLVAGRVVASNRLQHKGINCLDTHRIDIAGKVRVFCFDKTGTLTQDGLSFISFRPSISNSLGEAQQNFGLPMTIACKAAASCHSLAFYNDKYLGSSVETAMFKSTGWRLVSGSPDEVCSPDASLRIHVKRRLQFDQERRTMSVVVEEEILSSKGENFDPSRIIRQLYVKGAPESIARRCSSGIPPDFIQEGEKLASEGCYVLGLAYRQLTEYATHEMVCAAERDDLEQNLTFLGLMVFRNEVKPDAAFSISELKRGHIRCIMITGDNAPCGSFVAHETGLFEPGSEVVFGYVPEDNDKVVFWKTLCDNGKNWRSTASFITDISEQTELVVTGEAFDLLRSSGELFDKRVLFNIRVFARMSPMQKVYAVHAFMDGPDGVVCAMCGDGGNDSGALRAAHVGISMSSAEASVVAPFNTLRPEVFTCVELISEGRASLATSLASYKFLVVYGMLFSVVKLASFYYAILMSLMGYIMIDMLALIPLTFVMTLSKPLERLGPKRPTSSLLGAQTVSSIVGFLIIGICSMAVNLSIMSNSPGYVRWPSEGANTAAWWYISDNWESTVIFITCYLLFISASFSFSLGSGFRRSVFSNYWLIICWFILFMIGTLLFLLPLNWFSVQFHIASEAFNREGTNNPIWQKYQEDGGAPSPGMDFPLRLSIWILTCVAILLSVLWERLFVFGPGGRKISDAYARRSQRQFVKDVDFVTF